jgi:hypothetical protein
MTLYSGDTYFRRDANMPMVNASAVMITPIHTTTIHTNEGFSDGKAEQEWKMEGLPAPNAKRISFCFSVLT